ncbi:MAG TPA: carbamoyltransferase N-terminal domain-containing protein [Methylomirabilota bacterium]|nr:carbamoyltransferase N-terminal domain-containing protein [Methylomirabilota bacterium]
MSRGYVLGISAFYHDAAAALLRDGVLVAAAQEERFTRVKYDHRFPQWAIRYCLDEAGIAAQDLDYVVFYEKPLPKFERIVSTCLATFPRSWEMFREAMVAWFKEKLWIKEIMRSTLGVPPGRILFVEHHLSHAASAMFCSPFRKAAVLTVDGVGEWTTTVLGEASADWSGGENWISLSKELRFPHSLGLLYSAFTAWLGFKVNSGEYKVMGMARYGRPIYIDKVERVIKIEGDGSFRLDVDYFSFHYSPRRTYSDKFVALFGPPRAPEAPFFTKSTHGDVDGGKVEAARNQYYADVAASIQSVTEEILLRIVGHLHKETGLDDLVIAGGVALNSAANGRIMRESPFRRVYIQPNAGDAGGALGAALFAWHVMLRGPRRFVMDHAYYGKAYSDAEVASILDRSGISYRYFEDSVQIVSRATDAIRSGRVVGLFQGRFEWGPRALGNRSILADPRRPEMKEVVNSKIKFRELFRPFAPAILDEKAEQYFDLGKAAGQHPLRFMLAVVPVRNDREGDIPAVTHMGTGRLQTVDRQSNPLYYDIIKNFGDTTGVPVVLNTSFNLRGEPIVASPPDALRTFLSSDLDLLILNNFLLSKDRDLI